MQKYNMASVECSACEKSVPVAQALVCGECCATAFCSTACGDAGHECCGSEWHREQQLTQAQAVDAAFAPIGDRAN